MIGLSVLAVVLAVIFVLVWIESKKPKLKAVRLITAEATSNSKTINLSELLILKNKKPVSMEGNTQKCCTRFSVSAINDGKSNTIPESTAYYESVGQDWGDCVKVTLKTPIRAPFQIKVTNRIEFDEGVLGARIELYDQFDNLIPNREIVITDKYDMKWSIQSL